MVLEHDAFRVDYDPARVGVDAILAAIAGLGYEPEVATAREGGGERPAAKGPPAAAAEKPTPRGERPPIVAAAIARAGGRPLLLDFHAEWCVACRELEAGAMSDPQVRSLLGAFEQVRIDADAEAGAAEAFDVVALPTLVVLDGTGRERWRRVGAIEAGELVRELARWR